MKRTIINEPAIAIAELEGPRKKPPWLQGMTSLPFTALTPDEFEVLCFLLLQREHAEAEVLYYGKTGDGGRDVVVRPPGQAPLYFQCKHYAGRVGVNDVRAELAKLFSNLHAGLLPSRPADLTFMLTSDLTAKAQDLLDSQAAWISVAPNALKRHLGKKPDAALLTFANTWWPRLRRVNGVELSDRLRKYPELIEQFFSYRKVVDGSLAEIRPLLETLTERRSEDLPPSAEDSERLLEESSQLVRAQEFGEAASRSLEAADIARQVNNQDLLIRALRTAVRTLFDHVSSGGAARLGKTEVEHALSRMRSSIASIERVKEAEVKVAAERAWLELLEGSTSNALRFSEQAIEEAESPEAEAEALILCLRVFWQDQAPEKALKFRAKVERLAEGLIRDQHKIGLVLSAAWFRTLCMLERDSASHARDFADSISQLYANSTISAGSALSLIDGVVSELGRVERWESTLTVLACAMEVAQDSRDALRGVNIALQTAQIQAELDREADSKHSIGIAEGLAETLRSEGNRSAWASRVAALMVVRGRVESRLANHAESTDFSRSVRLQRAAHDSFTAARQFMERNEEDLTGDVGAFRSDLDLKLGESAIMLGRNTEAIDHFRRARSDQVMADERFAHRLGAQAWIREANALMLSGRNKEARSLFNDLAAKDSFSDEIRKEARRSLQWLDDVIFPMTEWLDSDAARSIGLQVARDGLRPVLAGQVLPFLEWCQEFSSSEGDRPYSELFDIWGRGGFSRVVSAIRAEPLNSISIDAISFDEIRHWARVFCPLYETLVINWKGPLNPALGMVPMPDHLGPPGAFGGQGYGRTDSEISGKEDWHVAIGWANFLPKDVSESIVEEAGPLLRSGRLVVLPAPLVGCTQTSVGWTDNLLLDRILGGVVKSVGFQEGEDRDNRICDLGSMAIPFIDNVRLADLNTVLDELADWLSPLRRLLRKSIGSKDLRLESWDSIGCYFEDIRDAFRQLDDRWKSLSISQGEWAVSSTQGSFSAVEKGSDTPGVDCITDFLRSMAGTDRNLGPWVPFWRLRQMGGEIDWTRTLDNRSEPPSGFAQTFGFNQPYLQGWLYPGDGGPGLLASSRL